MTNYKLKPVTEINQKTKTRTKSERKKIIEGFLKKGRTRSIK